MQQRQPVYEVDMADSRFDRSRKSLVPAQPQQKEKMRERAQHPLAYLFGETFAMSVAFVWSILSFIIAGFVMLITGRPKATHRHEFLAKQNQELDRVTELEEQFLSMASHELKTPMTTIRGEAQLMLRRLKRQKELSTELGVLRTALEKIDGQTRRLNTIVDDLLIMNTIRSGKIELRLGPCNLVDISRDAVEDQRLLTNRTIEFEVPRVAVMLYADSDRLSQVVYNLLDNAIKYSPEETSVRVCVDQYDGMALIQVHDAGFGVPEDQQAHIFEAFYRASNVQASSKSGLGLGLAICKDIVERHGGHIEYNSQIGKGSVFFVELPLA